MIFLSDNGRPFPRDKTSLYDSGIRTPLIIRWPAKIKAASRCLQLVSTIDLATTILALAGFPAGSSYMGKDITSLLEGKDAQVRDVIFAEKNWHDYEDRSRAVRDRRFKYIMNHYADLPATPPADAARSDTFREMQRLRLRAACQQSSLPASSHQGRGKNSTTLIPILMNSRIWQISFPTEILSCVCAQSIGSGVSRREKKTRDYELPMSLTGIPASQPRPAFVPAGPSKR